MCVYVYIDIYYIYIHIYKLYVLYIYIYSPYRPIIRYVYPPGIKHGNGKSNKFSTWMIFPAPSPRAARQRSSPGKPHTSVNTELGRSMGICTYICICIIIYIYICIYLCAFAYLYLYIYIYIYIYINSIYVCVYIYRYIHTYLCMIIDAPHAYIHIYIYIYVYLYTYMYVCTHRSKYLHGKCWGYFEGKDSSKGVWRSASRDVYAHIHINIIVPK